MQKLWQEKVETEDKILVVRFSSIGDIVLTSPVLRCLAEQMPGYEIHFLTKAPYSQLVAHHPAVKKVYTIEKGLDEVAEALRAENYRYVIDLHDNLRSRRVAHLLHTAKVFRYSRPLLRRWLHIHLKLPLMPHGHVVDWYFSAVRSLGVQHDGKGLELHIPPEAQVPVDKLPFTHLAGYAVLVAGAAHFTKQIPLGKLEQICRESPMPLVIIGGKEDAVTGYHLEQVDPLKVYSTCGQLSLLQSASLISRAKWVITPDTGMMHIAAAFQRRIISIWGSTTPRMGFTPYIPEGTASHLLEAEDILCRPCHKHGRPSCPKGHFNCMNKNDVGRVSAILQGTA